jgi:hypothetical protein
MRAALRLGFLAGALLGCGPYAELGQKLDVGSTFEGEAWIAASGDEVRLLYLGTPSGGAPAPFAFTSMSLPIAAGVSAWAVQGTATGGPSDPNLTLSERLLYEMVDERGTPLLNRHGTTRQDVDRTLVLGQRRAGDALVLSGDPSVAATYVPLRQAMSALAPTSSAGAACAFHLANLAVLTSQVRIIAFGSAGMSQYKRAATFMGTRSGAVTVSVSGTFSVTTDITYAAYSDFDGAQLDGTQTTHVDSGGNGSMSGVLSIALAPAAPAAALDGTVTYGPGADAIRISSGSPSGGLYLVTMGAGGSATVDPVAPPSPSIGTCLGLP